MALSRAATLALALLLCASARAAEVAPGFRAPAVVPPAALGLAGVTWRPNYAAGADGRPLEPLGSGKYGAAYVHPTDPALMLKVAADLYGTSTFARTRSQMRADILQEAEGTRLVAEAGAGPRLIAVTKVPYRSRRVLAKVAGWLRLPEPELSRPALVKERVVGETLSALKLADRFGPEEAALVAELKARLAAAGLTVEDPHGDNIMIGTTASAPQPRAHLVDAGSARAAP